LIAPFNIFFSRFKDGLEIHDSERIKTEVFPKGIAELSIHNSTVRDIGLYTCEAHNMAGRAQSMVRVSVRGKYMVTRSLFFFTYSVSNNYGPNMIIWGYIIKIILSDQCKSNFSLCRKYLNCIKPLAKMVSMITWT
jgi:hypothetical protein